MQKHGRNNSISIMFAVIISLIASPLFAQNAPSFSSNLATSFDWQKTWGSIHINSYADNLNDPGIPSTSNGVVSCPAGANQCGANGIASGSIVHGIKYDIKNSVVNCMSVQTPNCAANNGGCPNPAPPYDRGGFTDAICSMGQGTHGNVGGVPLHDPYSLVYMPIYDARSNDDAFLGVQQLITNNCIRDIHSEDEGLGALTPISHVFSADEKDGWIIDKDKKGMAKGAQLPDQYYFYKNKADDAWVYSNIMPKDKDVVAGSLKTVDNYSNELARIKSYTLKNTADSDSFIIIDPSQFFDLRQYSYAGSPAPYENCPVLGLKMYDGVCDPTGVAGCNLPVYGVGPKTTFTGQNGKEFSTNNFPIVWSGYVTKWAYITPDQYLAQVKNRTNVDGQQLYMQPINSNPILMVQRAASYCTFEEMTSDPSKGQTDLPCIQYLQYTTDGSHALAGKFVDMYNPTNDAGTTNNAAAYVVKHDYHINSDGSLGDAVMGPSGKPLSFFDTATTFSYKGKTTTAVEPSRTVTANDGKIHPGKIQGKGAGIEFTNGTTIAVQLDNQSVKFGGKDVNCIEFSNGPVPYSRAPVGAGSSANATKDLFIPTNTVVEYQSFVDSVVAGISGLNVTASPCSVRYKSYTADSNQSNPNGTQTWFGTTSCTQIAAPSCNQVTTISAQRYCQRSTGFLGSCDDCADVNDTDGKLDPGPGGMIATYNVPDKNGKTNTCYFKAYCYSLNACPGLKTGGHVFCLSADTKIMMADGTQKDIVNIKAGDEVMAFDAKHSKGMLRKSKVRATAITKDQKLIQIDDLKITPLHKVVLANGRAVMAKDIKVGDSILKASGLFEVVKKIEKDLPATTVYNLALEDADGYIANGLRVLQYPIAEELVK